jgi:hypothetical protein
MNHSASGKWSLESLSILAALILLSCSPTPEPEKPSTDSKYAEGQVWKYRTTIGTDSSRIVIGRIETIDEFGTVYGISVVGLPLVDPNGGPGAKSVIPHLPMTVAALDKSVTVRVDTTIEVARFDTAYAEWKMALGMGVTGVYIGPVDAIVQDLARFYEASAAWEKGESETLPTVPSDPALFRWQAAREARARSAE